MNYNYYVYALSEELEGASIWEIIGQSFSYLGEQVANIWTYFQNWYNYLLSATDDIISMFNYFRASHAVFFNFAQLIPSIIYSCAVVVVGVSVVKIIFGR